ncbi:MAG: DnaD domain protein [Bacillota bacterium]|nr:DnaD domain protein [Bacillota bacterium]
MATSPAGIVEEGLRRGRVRPGRSRGFLLVIPPELLEHYQPVIGALGVAVWINLRWQAAAGGESREWDDWPGRLGISKAEWEAALKLLLCYDLIRIEQGPEGEPSVVVNDPLPEEEFAASFVRGVEEAAAPEPPPPPVDPQLEAVRSLERVFQAYHDHIGLMSPLHFERLRTWVEERGMHPDVVVAAIEETARTATFPRIQYLEGILRNWYNDGIRTPADLKLLQPLSSPERRQQEDYEGAPNALAYRRVESEAVRRWKELYKDEYGD